LEWMQRQPLRRRDSLEKTFRKLCSNTKSSTYFTFHPKTKQLH
jgi:hypothetical protein